MEMMKKLENNWSLEGRRILISGGSKGIGRAIAHECAMLGARVWLVARGQNGLDAVATELGEYGCEARTTAADAAADSFTETIATQVDKEWGALDGLVINAGLNIRKKAVDYEPGEPSKIWKLNMEAAFSLATAMHPFLEAGAEPAVVSVASVAARFDVQSGAPYGMSKAALVQMSRHLAVEWAPEIRVNAVSPWYTNTPLAKPVLTNTQKRNAILARTPLGRIAEPGEIARAAVFLLMPVSGYVTGHNLVVDGGMGCKGL